jgi:hypothetical protein
VNRPPLSGRIIRDLRFERMSQLEKWGEQSHLDGTAPTDANIEARDAAIAACNDAHNAGVGTWRHIVDEELAEAYCEDQPMELRAELVQVLAVVAAWIDDIDSRLEPGEVAE